MTSQRARPFRRHAWLAPWLATCVSTCVSTCVAMSALLVLQACAGPRFEARPSPVRHPIFAWRVEGNGLPSPAYLLGSTHLGKDDSWLVPEIVAIMEQSTALIVELDAAAAAQDQGLEAVGRLGMYPSDDALKNHIPAEVYAKAMRAGAEAGLPPFALERMRPWLAALTLTTVTIQREGWSEDSGVETILLRRAKEKKITVVELETLEEQLSLFATMDDDMQLLFLTQALEQVRKESGHDGEAPLEKLRLAWLRGDVIAFEKEILGSRAEDPRFEPLFVALFDRRNEQMVERALAVLQRGNAFVVVGAGHMVGDKGIVALLKARGFTVTQLETVPTATTATTATAATAATTATANSPVP